MCVQKYLRQGNVLDAKRLVEFGEVDLEERRLGENKKPKANIRRELMFIMS